MQTQGFDLEVAQAGSVLMSALEPDGETDRGQGRQQRELGRGTPACSGGSNLPARVQ